jgi:hypothetical protein
MLNLIIKKTHLSLLALLFYSESAPNDSFGSLAITSSSPPATGNIGTGYAGLLWSISG